MENLQDIDFLTYSELLEYKNTNTPLVPGLLYRGDGVILAGKAEVGKSLFSLQLCMALATGKMFLDKYAPISPLKVCYIPTEGSLGTVKERAVLFGNAYKLSSQDSNFRILKFFKYKLNTIKGFDYINKSLDSAEFKPDLIIIDTLYLSCHGSLIKDDVATDYCQYLNLLIDKYNCAVILVHHYGKDQHNAFDGRVEREAKDVLGSSCWANWATSILRMVKQYNTIKLSVGKDRNNKLFSGDIQLNLIQNEKYIFYKRVKEEDNANNKSL